MRLALAETVAWAALLAFGLLGCAQTATPQRAGAVPPAPPLLRAATEGPKVTMGPSITIDESGSSSAGRALLQTAAQTKAKMEALQALLAKFPCEEGCSGHGKCKTLAHLSDPTQEPIKATTIHGRRDLETPTTRSDRACVDSTPCVTAAVSAIGRHGQALLAPKDAQDHLSTAA